MAEGSSFDVLADQIELLVCAPMAESKLPMDRRNNQKNWEVFREFVAELCSAHGWTVEAYLNEAERRLSAVVRADRTAGEGE